jgi:hypothetical protein
MLLMCNGFVNGPNEPFVGSLWLLLWELDARACDLMIFLARTAFLVTACYVLALPVELGVAHSGVEYNS